ncbi:hypothetical protein [Pseudovibrio brasiliensis]|uniref:Uncharacterized protein n=1 Tax=Pseudovibrio brasiliensis TaxID=1898042 RepID=A0ABX8AXB8_9HYPH|nr:hypothetical protein [Pseudovibrio brasiliensis]QUS58540.1 hypothetical protein KGB56_22760 [Pseudovibrio brasiliensis]
MSFKSILRFSAHVAQERAASAVAVGARKKRAVIDGYNLNSISVIKDERLINPSGMFYVSNTLKDIGSATLQIIRGATVSPLYFRQFRFEE